MGSLNPDDKSKQDLDDSGYIQDEATSTPSVATSTPAMDEYKGTAQLLDLSDDVLLMILLKCSPLELKALGFTCPRLGALVLDRTLWVDVDTMDTPHGRRRVRWLLSQALGPHTRRLRLYGYARENEGCLGFVNRYNNMEATIGAAGSTPEIERYICGGPRVYRLSQTLPRYGGGFPYWPYGPAGRQMSAPAAAPPSAKCCPGPQLTLTHTGLRELVSLCTGLKTLELEDCVIDCQTTNIGMFPKTLTKLSLRGTKCFNLEAKSFLFKIQDHLTLLEELDVSYCSWLEPACMLPLSKMPCLRSLAMKECYKMTEFVAYASLATRYGFKSLKYLDLRGSPVGDSEVSTLSWLPCLEELYLSPPTDQPRINEHAHCSQKPLPTYAELEAWEEEEPDYFKAPRISDQEWLQDEENVRGNRSLYYNNTNNDPSECILLERMIAEPVAPAEYSQVYRQFLAMHNGNIPLANPDEYRQAYQLFMARPNARAPSTGYSLFIRRPGEERREPPPKRGKDEAKPGTSGTTSEASARVAKRALDDAKPGPSQERAPGCCPTHSLASEDSSDDDDTPPPPPKRPCCTPPRMATRSDSAKKDARGAKKSTKKQDDKHEDDDDKKDDKDDKRKPDKKKPRRIFEITINELNTEVHELIEREDERADNAANNAAAADAPADAANDAANEPNNNARDVINIANEMRNERNINIAGNVPAISRMALRVIADGFSAAISHAQEAIRTGDSGGCCCVTSDSGDADNAADDEEFNKSANNVAECDAPPNNAEVNNAPPGVDVSNAEFGKGDAGDAGDGDAGKDAAAKGAADDGAPNDPAADDGAVERAADDGATNNAAANVVDGNNAAVKAANNPAANNGAANNPAANNAAAYNAAANRLLSMRAATIRAANIVAANNAAIMNREHEAYNLAALNREDGNAGLNRGAAQAVDANNPDRVLYNQRLLQFRTYRRPIIIEEFNECEEQNGPRRLPRAMLFSGGSLPGGPARLDHTALVSDSSIRRFGRAIGGIGPAVNARPDRSNLRVLSVTGYRHVTDHSLTHLATAAPLLQTLDVSSTGVTARALSAFRALRPDVAVTSNHDAPV